MGFGSRHHVDVGVGISDQMHVGVTHARHQDTISTVDDDGFPARIFADRGAGHPRDGRPVDQDVPGDE